MDLNYEPHNNDVIDPSNQLQFLNLFGLPLVEELVQEPIQDPQLQWLTVPGSSTQPREEIMDVSDDSSSEQEHPLRRSSAMIHQDSNRISWVLFQDSEIRSVVKETDWKTHGFIRLQPHESLVEHSLNIFPCWLQENVIIKVGSNLTRGVFATSLEDYLYYKPSWRKTQQEHRPIIGDPFLTLVSLGNDVYRFDFECQFLLHRNFIVADQDQGRRRITCEPGSFSLCIEIVIQNNQTGGKIMCRRWSDGFSIVLVNDRTTPLEKTIPAPPEEYILLPASYVAKPPRLTGPSRKRSFTNNSIVQPVQPVKQEELFFKVVQTNFGVVHSLKESSITLCFEGNAEPRQHIELRPFYQHQTLWQKVEWISSHCLSITFGAFPRVLENPSKLSFLYLYGGKNYMEEILIETCSTCEKCEKCKNY